MTIRRGAEWGEPIERPTELLSAGSDAEFVRLVGAAGRDTPVTLSGGDLHRSLGSPAPRREMRRLPLDLIDVHLDGESVHAVSHVLIAGSLWRGDLIVVSNVGLVGSWNVAPRAHPNDGKLDLIEVPKAFGLRQRIQAYRRLPSGTHVPHPLISYRQVTSARWSFGRPVKVRVDGASPVNASEIEVEVLADAAAVLI